MPKKRRAPSKPAPRKYLTREDILRTPAAPKDDPGRLHLLAAAATLRGGFRDLDRRVRWLDAVRLHGHAPTPPAPTPSRPRGGRKLTDEVWHEHLRRHPLTKTGPDGKLLGAPQRTRLLKEDQSIVVDRSRVTVRLQKARSIPS